MTPRLARLARSSALILAVAGCEPSEEIAKDADEQEIHDRLDEYSQALLNRDTAALDDLWADDLTFVNLRGEMLTKQDRMDNIKSGATAFNSIRLSDEKVRIYGETAVATFQAALAAQYSNQEGSGDFRVTTVWTRPKGDWHMVAVQMTKISPNP